MGKLTIKPFEHYATNSGISMSQGETRGRCFYRIGITKPAQIELFGRELDPAKDRIALTVTDFANLNDLMGIALTGAKDASGLPLNGGVHGSVSIKVTPWRKANGKAPAAGLTVVNSQVEGGGISVRLPSWAVPPANMATSTPALRS